MSVPPIDPLQPPSDMNAGFPAVASQRMSINVFALVGFVMAITGIGCCIPGSSLILCIIGLNQINKEPDRYNGKGLAIAGIVIYLICFVYVCATWNSLKNTGF